MCKPLRLASGLVIVLTGALLIACGRSEQPDVAPVQRVPTWTPAARAQATVLSPLVVATTIPTALPAMAPADLLPAPLYFIDYASGQIVRMARDGRTSAAITDEQEPVLDFDVSPSDGHLVYVSGNDLVERDARGGNRRVRVNGPNLPPVDPQHAIVRYGVLRTVAAPRFSPDGQQIAFGLGGVNLITTTQPATPLLILASDPYTPPVTMPIGGNYFLPYAWSPDGAYLLVEARGYWEGMGWGSLAQPGKDNHYTQMAGCCNPIWSLQSDALYFSDAFGMEARRGLYQVLLASGELRPLLEEIAVASPHVSRAGHLLAFVASAALVPTIGPELLALHRIELTAGNAQVVRLRSDEYDIGYVLWARNSRGALIVERIDPPESPRSTGALTWVPVDGGPAIALGVVGSHPHWEWVSASQP